MDLKNNTRDTLDLSVHERAYKSNLLYKPVGTLSPVNEIDNEQILITSPKKPNKLDKIQEEACCNTQSPIRSKFATADKQNIASERTK